MNSFSIKAKRWKYYNKKNIFKHFSISLDKGKLISTVFYRISQLLLYPSNNVFQPYFGHAPLKHIQIRDASPPPPPSFTSHSAYNSCYLKCGRWSKISSFSSLANYIVFQHHIQILSVFPINFLYMILIYVFVKCDTTHCVQKFVCTEANRQLFLAPWLDMK